MSETENIKLEIKKIIPAKREDVFRAWTEPELMKQWWQQLNVKQAETIKLDLRVGGKYEIHMRTQAETVLMQGEYLEINEPEKLVFTWRTEFTYNQDTKVTVLLRDLGDETELMLRHEGFPDEKSRAGNLKGWSAIIDNLGQVNF